MARLRALLAGAIASLMIWVPTSASAGPNPDVHRFEAQVVAAGTAFVNFGREGKDPTITTGSGVDGTDSMGWRWETRAVAISVGNGPLVGTAEIIRERAFLDASVVSWGVQMGNYEEDSLCDALQGRTTFVSDDFEGLGPGKSSRGEFVRALNGTPPPKFRDPEFRIGSGGLSVSGFGYAGSFTCFHGPYGHGLNFFEQVRAGQAPVARGDFNPRFDRSYRHTFTDSARVGREHSSSDPNSAHTFEGQSRLTVEVNAISERRFKKLNRKYNRTAGGGAASSYFD
ncbi:MAG: hypothetical protein ACSLFI_01595 [Solirubrobacterales bacterium]